MLVNFQSFPTWANLLIFAVAAVAIWFAGTRLERYSDAIAERTGLGQAFTGMLLLAGATSLPEVATTVTAVLIGNPTLAIFNLLGGIVLQTAILALADRFKRHRGALTFFTPDFVLLIEGLGLVVLLLLTIMGGISGAAISFSFWGIGIWPVIFFGVYLLVMYQTHRYQGQPRWLPDHTRPKHEGDRPERSRQRDEGDGQDTRRHDARHAPAWGQRQAEPEPAGRKGGERRAAEQEDGGGRQDGERRDRSGSPGDEDQERRGPGEDQYPERPLGRIYLYFAGCSLVILVAGWAVSSVADAFTRTFGLTSAFVGATLVAAVTSLPEISTTITAARERDYSMAFSNVFGSNALMVALLLLADVLYRQGPVMEHVPQSVLFISALGAVVTCVYLWGLLERENRTILGIGYDSALVVLLYLGGMVVLYLMSGSAGASEGSDGQRSRSAAAFARPPSISARAPGRQMVRIAGDGWIGRIRPG